MMFHEGFRQVFLREVFSFYTVTTKSIRGLFHPLPFATLRVG